MSNRDRIVEFLRSAGHAGATNQEIVSRTGIRPHQQVFTITRDLMRQGRIKGVQSGKEWRFWLWDGDGAERLSFVGPVSAARPTRIQSDPTPAEFERLALSIMSNAFGTRLAPARVPGVPKLFDCVSQDRLIVGDVKFFTLVKGERLPPAKFSIIAEHVWLLEKTGAPRKFLVFGNDQRVPEEWLRRYGHLASSVEFFFIDHAGVAIQLDTGA